ncbi:TetR/AcrR family transcriptional regulator [Henriciella sp. AS95]|uniref:TetR/AcrR family transcriptional regulator n=1 Tax=Henriciella sp. AS95 TaxID=3135782 RepID=UPI00316E3D53
MLTQNASDAAEKRTSPSDTRILLAANEVYKDNPVLPLPLSSIAERANVSRALIYSHYPDQYALVSALIASHVSMVWPASLEILRGDISFHDTAEKLAGLHFEHFIKHGLLLANAPQDDFLVDHLPWEFSAKLRFGLVRLASKARRQYGFSTREAISAVLLLGVIPEQAARLVRNRQISPDGGRRGLKRAIRVSTRTFKSE